jgi:hypothetical protein
MPARIEEALRAVVEFFGVDRNSLGELQPDIPNIVLRASYGRPGVPLSIPLHGAIRMPLPWFTEQLLHGRTVRISRLSEVPPEASRDREFAEGFGHEGRLGRPGPHVRHLALTAYPSFRSPPTSTGPMISFRG